MTDLTSTNSPTEPHREPLDLAPTQTEPHQDVRERAARALYEHRQAIEAAPQDGYTAWDDLPEDWQDEYREAADAVLAAVSAAAPDEREALDVTRLPERFRFSREVYGDVADDATRVLLALTDGGHADQPSDYLRWVSITAAQALAARPAPAAEDDAVEKAAQAVWERRSRARQIEGRGELKPWHIAVVQAAAWPSSPVAGEVAACRQDARAALDAAGVGAPRAEVERLRAECDRAWDVAVEERLRRLDGASAAFDRWLAAHDAEVLRATANDMADWLGSSDLMADEISDHGIDVILRWLRERAGQVEREGGEGE